MRILILMLALVALASTTSGCATRGETALGDDCNVCDLTKDAAGKAAGGGTTASSGVDQVQAPFQMLGRGPDLKANTSTGAGGLWSSDESKKSGQLGTGGNQYQGILNYLPGIASGGGASPLEISLAKALVSCDKRMNVCVSEEQYKILADQRADLLDRMERAGASGTGRITNNFWLHGSKAQILGLSKATADTGKTTDDKETEAYKAGAGAVFGSSAEVFKAENGANVPAVPEPPKPSPSFKMPDKPVKPVAPKEPDAPKPPAGAAGDPINGGK